MTSHRARAFASSQFQTERILTITGGHTVHDAFSAFFPPLLPKIQEKLSLTYAQIGSLSFGMQIPFISTLFLGYLADHLSVRYFVIVAPVVTATLMSLLGLANSYWTMMALVVVAGFSVAAFHAPAPAMISHIAGKRVGLGMSLFMGSGELGRTVGPLLVAGGFVWFGLEGLWRIMFLGWGTSLLLYWRLRDVSGRPAQQAAPETLMDFLRGGRRVLGLVNGMVAFRNFLHVVLTTYLPLYMRDVLGAAFVRGALSLTLLEGAGVVGALIVGPLSDYIPRKRILATLFVISPLLVFAFMRAPAQWAYWLLPAVGFFSLSTTPVILTILQTRFPRNRALASGTFMSMGVVSRSVITWLLGLVADRYDLTVVFYLSTAASVLSLPLLLLLSETDTEMQ